MSVKGFARNLRIEIEAIRDQGTAAIYTDNLINYLKNIEESPEPTTTPEGLEEYKAHLQNWVESNRHQHESNMEMFRSVISSGQNALKSAFLLNGGAAVALLAFVGHLAEFKPALVSKFASGLLPFVLGVLVITLTSGLTYLSQWLYSSPKSSVERMGKFCNILAIILGFCSSILFSWGVYEAYLAFSSYA